MEAGSCGPLPAELVRQLSLHLDHRGLAGSLLRPQCRIKDTYDIIARSTSMQACTARLAAPAGFARCPPKLAARRRQAGVARAAEPELEDTLGVANLLERDSRQVLCLPSPAVCGQPASLLHLEGCTRKEARPNGSVWRLCRWRHTAAALLAPPLRRRRNPPTPTALASCSQLCQSMQRDTLLITLRYSLCVVCHPCVPAPRACCLRMIWFPHLDCFPPWALQGCDQGAEG